MSYQANRVTDVNNLGFFATPEALEAAYPVGAPGYFAIVGSTDTVWVWDSNTNAWVDSGSSGGGITSISIASSNGFAGSSSGGSTPILTISTSVTGILRGNGTSVAAAVAGDFPTLNQNTTGSAATLTTARTIGTATGDVTSAGSSFNGSANNTNVYTLATVNSNVGSFGSATTSPTYTVNAKGLITAAANVTITPAIGSITGLGTGVATALATAVGSAGAPVVFNGALGTPSSGTVTNLTGTASININGTVGATTPTTGSFTSVTTSGNIELGNASDTTLSRVAAGVVAIEGATINGYATTATAAGTTTLTIASARTQYFTGTSTQTVRLPTTSVLAGQTYTITNLSTGLLTVQSSGANTIETLGLNQTSTFTAIVATPTTAANWTYNVSNLAGNAQGKRLLTVTQAATPAMNTNNGDIMQMTGLAQAITSMTTNLTGNPSVGDQFMFQITDNGTGRAITWGASFSSTTIALPTTTVASTMLRVGFQWNGSTWACIAVA